LIFSLEVVSPRFLAISCNRAMLLAVFVVLAWFAARHYFIRKERAHLAKQKKPAPARKPTTPESSERIVVVTGGQGFLGQHVVKQACDGGYYTVVRVYDRVGTERRCSLGNGVTLEVYVGDLVDEPKLQEVCAGAEAVLHTAALIDDVVTQRLRQANVEGTAAVVRACLACNVLRLAHVSSIGACFTGTCEPGTVWNEVTADFGTDISKQVYVYGRAKAAGELLVRLADGQQGLATVAVRPHYIFGYGDLQAQVIKQTGKPVPIFGSGTTNNTVGEPCLWEAVPLLFLKPRMGFLLFAVYVKNCAGWLLAADAALRDPKRRSKVRGRPFFIGDGNRTVKQMNEVRGRKCIRAWDAALKYPMV
jgi:nucleoside-diphosphate-sugar epimerase